MLSLFLVNVLGFSIYICQATPVVLANHSEMNQYTQNEAKMSNEEITNTEGKNNLETTSTTQEGRLVELDPINEENSSKKINLKTTKANEINNNFYILKPVLTKANHLVADVNMNTKKLILYGQHGLGNQLFGVEWRPESEGYILFLSKNKQNLLKPEGNSAGSKITIETQVTPVNNLSRFSEDYLWDIVAVGENYVFLNKKNKLALTVLDASSGAELTLQKQTNETNQQIKLEQLNGYYSIKSVGRSTTTKSSVFDIQGGVGVDKDIIAYQDYGSLNQKWFILYSTDIDGYVIGNAKDKTILISSEQGEGKSPISKYFNPLEKVASKFRHVFSAIVGEEGSYSIFAGKFHIAAASDTNQLTYSESSRNYMGRWNLISQGAILPPNLLDFKLNKQEETPLYYVGETIDFSARVETSDFKNVAAFVRTDSGTYDVIGENMPVVDNKVLITKKVSTLEMTEGEHFIEVLAKGDGLFISNALAAKVKIAYPTPTAEPVSRKVFRYREIKDLKATDFVKDPHDEMGNPIEAKIVSIDTSTIGNKVAVISLKNQYKETLINVPVEIIKEPAKLQVNFVNEIEELLPGYSLTIDGFVGDPIDLTKENKVIEQLANINKAGYELAKRPESEDNIAIASTAVTVNYKLQGLISFTSIPANLDFGTLTYKAENRRIEFPSFDKELIVTDTRADASKGFRMSAVLTKALTDEKGNQLVDALTYSYQGKEKLLGEQEQIVYVNTKGVAGSFAITDSWGSNQADDGLKLEIKGTTMLYPGSYQGIITWKLMADEPQ